MTLLSFVSRMVARIRNIIFKPWPNVHMPATASKRYSLKNGGSVLLRPSFSDWARRCEYEASIYVPDNHLTLAVRNLKPTLLVDIGANIGLSSLSLLECFPSIRQIVGIEAEKENFEVLKLNYGHWASIALPQDIEMASFSPIYAIASNITDDNVTDIQATRLPGGLSASGTFKFVSCVHDTNKNGKIDNQQTSPVTEFAHRKICISDIFAEYLKGNLLATAVVKIDIEGGEEELFLGMSEWLTRTAFLTVEIHDAMGSPRSSRGLLEKLAAYDFAIVPEEDVLHCYNRRLLNIQ